MVRLDEAWHPSRAELVAIAAQKPDNGARGRGSRRKCRPKTCRRVNRGTIKRGVEAQSHARIFGRAKETHDQSVEDLRRGDDRRYARFLRLPADRVCSRVLCQGLESDLWPVGGDTAVCRDQRAVRLDNLGLGRRQDRPAQGHDCHDPEFLDRDGVDGADPGAWLGVFGDLPLFRRVRGHRPLYRRYCRGAGIRACLQARLDHRGDDHDVAGRAPPGGGARAISHGLCRLARPVRDRAAAGRLEPLDPRLGAGIPALADPRRPPRGSAPIPRLGVDDRPEGNCAAGRRSAGREGRLARAVQISAEHRGRLPGRPYSDRRRRVRAVAGHAVRHAAARHPGSRPRAW